MNKKKNQKKFKLKPIPTMSNNNNGIAIVSNDMFLVADERVRAVSERIKLIAYEAIREAFTNYPHADDGWIAYKACRYMGYTNSHISWDYVPTEDIDDLLGKNFLVPRDIVNALIKKHGIKKMSKVIKGKVWIDVDKNTKILQDS